MADPKEPSFPLTEDDLATLREQIRNLDLADSIISKAQRAGIDVGTTPQQTKDFREQIHKIANTFFPGKGLR